jgi:hypothetical protein
MDWAKFDLRMNSPAKIKEEDRQTVLHIAEEAIMRTDIDPEVVLDAAARVLHRADSITNVAAYAKRAILRALRRAGLAQRRKDPLANSDALTDYSDFRHDSIENEILVRDLLDSVDVLDREIFQRRMNGETFRQIDCELNLHNRTAENRFGHCKRKLERSLGEKLRSRKRERGV